VPGNYPKAYIGKAEFEHREGFCAVAVQWSWTPKWSEHKDELWWDPASMGIAEQPDGTVIWATQKNPTAR
jgi:hypothetical protein